MSVILIASAVTVAVAVSIVCMLFVYNKIKPGYVFENETWNYVSYDTGVGRRVSPLDIDKDNFKKLKYNNFATDGECVWHKAYRIDGSDSDTFKVISNSGRWHYAKDKDNVYVYYPSDSSVLRVIGADPETFEVLTHPYAKDKNDAYNGTLPLFVDGVEKFRLTEKGSGVFSMTSLEVFWGGDYIFAPDGAAQYNTEKYSDAIKESDGIMYASDGKAETDKLVYHGHIVIEDRR